MLEKGKNGRKSAVRFFYKWAWNISGDTVVEGMNGGDLARSWLFFRERQTLHKTEKFVKKFFEFSGASLAPIRCRGTQIGKISVREDSKNDSTFQPVVNCLFCWSSYFLIFGPKRLPDLASSLWKIHSSSLRKELNDPRRRDKTVEKKPDSSELISGGRQCTSLWKELYCLRCRSYFIAPLIRGPKPAFSSSV